MIMALWKCQTHTKKLKKHKKWNQKARGSTAKWNVCIHSRWQDPKKITIQMECLHCNLNDSLDDFLIYLQMECKTATLNELQFIQLHGCRTISCSGTCTSVSEFGEKLRMQSTEFKSNLLQCLCAPVCVCVGVHARECRSVRLNEKCDRKASFPHQLIPFDLRDLFLRIHRLRRQRFEKWMCYELSVIIFCFQATLPRLIKQLISNVIKWKMECIPKTMAQPAFVARFFFIVVDFRWL